MLSESQLREIMPNLPASKAALFLPHLNQAMAEYGIDSMLRTAAFAAQLAHESGEFRWMEEIWGPTPAQRNYEPVTDLSKRLGNTEPGDGKRFKGRGPIQLTGRANYQRFGGLLGIDLMAAPEQAAAPEAAFRVAALYWKNRGLNELADAQDFREITRRINGGFNGLADRQMYYERAKAVLTAGFEAGGQLATRGLSVASTREVPAEPLTRGFEAIRQLAARKKPVKKPAKKKAPPKKRVAKKKAATEKPPVRKKPTSKTTVKKPAKAKAPTKKTSAKNPVDRKTAAAKKPVAEGAKAKKAVTKKAITKRPATKKGGTKKPSTRKTSVASRTPARRR